jgi:hypothetical protein
MKHTSIISPIFAISISLLMVWLPVSAQDSGATNPASPSAEPDFEVIKENVKKRLQEVVQDKVLGDSLKEPLAVIGSLKSLAGNTYSIETSTSVKLVSTSDQTQVSQIPKGGALTLEDVALEDYIVAVGFLGSDDVLDARQILIHKTAPGETKYKMAYGMVTAYDPKTFTLTLQNPADNSNFSCIISRRATIKQVFANDTDTVLARTNDLPENAHVLIIYLPGEAQGDDNVAYQVLIKTDPPGYPDEAE